MTERTRNGLQGLRDNNNGLTLVELLVAVLLLSFVMFGVVTVLQSTFRGYSFVQSETSASTQAQASARAFTAGVRNASHLEVTDTLVRSEHASTGECMTWRIAGDNLYGSIDGGETLLASGVSGSFEGATPQGSPSIPGATLNLAVDTRRQGPVDITTTVFPRYQSEESSPCVSD
ncbi:prepilin-type N-terminal cleavage/methylation domain-containing protein [Nesterenkonia populi]